MALNFLTPSEAGDQYLLHVKSLKREVDIARTDSDWWVRSRVVGGLVSGLYADQRKIADDAFPQSARHDALARHLDLYFGSGFKTATESNGPVKITGISGSTIFAGTQGVYLPNGNAYQTETDLTLVGSSGLVNVVSIDSGQNQNLLPGAELTISSPPTGIDPLMTVFGDPLADGRDDETDAEAAQRILTRVQNPISGGTVTDYEQWAVAADPSVIEANVIRFINGPGTVGVVFTAGTTNIDDAINNNIPIVRIPSDELVAKVQAYIDVRKPLTDCAHVMGAHEVTQDVTMRVRFVDGTLSTIPAGQTLTQEQLVQREISRALYKTPPGGRQFGATGFVVASEIEQVVDDGLSAEPYNTGIYATILSDRQIDDLSASGPNRTVLDDEIVKPGVITIVEM